jgi:hypothetical protein
VLLAPALAAVAALGVIASGCGGSSGEGVAGVETTETTTESAGTTPDTQNGASEPNPAAYSACMRKNGVPQFPDPDANGMWQAPLLIGGAELDENSPAFKKADDACKKYLPAGGGGDTLSPEEQAGALAYSACMRENGVPNFPDPEQNAEGGIGMSVDKDSGIDPNSPQFKEAEQACEDLDPRATSTGGGANSNGGS